MENVVEIRKEEEVRRRYWVNCPTVANDPSVSGVELESEEDERLKRLEQKLEEEFYYSDECSMVYKTWDLKDAKDKARFAQKILEEAGCEGLEDAVGIVTQPICPKCGQLGRFADFYCSSCGGELLPKVSIDFA